MNRLFAVSCAAGVIATSSAAHALVITPFYDSTIASASNANDIETDIGNAMQFYQNSFSDPINVSIVFRLAASSTFLGSSNTTLYTTSDTSFVSKLTQDANTHPLNTPLQTALGNLATGNQATDIRTTSADMRALGYTGTPGKYDSAGVYGSGTYDGVITLSSSQPLVYAGAVNSSSYDALRVIEHEIDEVLGVGGASTVLNTMYNSSLTTPPVINGQPTIGALDLYRYSAPGVASLSTSASVSSYFSIDGGVTSLAPFNQNPGQPTKVGDFADWGGSGCPAFVQQAFSCKDQLASLTMLSPESMGLMALGYDPISAVPELPSFIMFGAGLAGVLLLQRRRQPG